MKNRSSQGILTRLLLGILVLFGANNLVAQGVNLISNPSFELNTSLPTIGGELFKSLNWTNLNGGTDWPYATPDYFHVSGTGDAALPNSFAGTVSPQDGNGIAGFITFNVFYPEFREYLSQPLAQPMTPGVPYEVSFWLTNGSADWMGALGSNNIGIYFSQGSPSQNVNQVIPVTPQIEITAVTHHTSWVKYTFSFTPSVAFDHMTIGNFRTDAATTRQVFTTGTGISYYFLDQVSVSEAGPLAATDVRLSQDGSASGMALTWMFPVDGSAGDWVLERSENQETFGEVASYLELGAEMAGLDMRYEDADALPNTTYFYRLRHQGLDGTRSYSEVLIAAYEGEATYQASAPFPNPANDHFSLDFSASEPGDLQVEVMDLNGSISFREMQSLDAGHHQVDYTFDRELSPGLYLARFSWNGEHFTRKLIVGN